MTWASPTCSRMRATCSSMMLSGVQVAGKTGTAQVIGIRQNEKYDERKVAQHFRDHSLYMGYAPVENPRIALAMVVENGGFGARTAAPIARKLFDFYLLGKRPTELDTPVNPADIEPDVPEETQP